MERNEIKHYLSWAITQQQKEDDDLKKAAESAFKLYQANMAAGFTPEQALNLVAEITAGIFKNSSARS